MKIATVAMDTVWKDCAKNVVQTEEHVAAVMAAQPETDVIVFPEISLMGFVVDPSNREIAEPIDGHCVSEVKRIAREHSVALICGFIEQNGDDKPFNTSFVVSKDGELVAKYSKNHLFSASAEPEVYTPGATLTTFELAGWKCGLAICFDNRYPRLFEAYRQAGVECIFCPCNWVKGRNKPAILENITKTRAHETQTFCVALDRSGSDPNTSYHGISVIANPYCEDVGIRDGIYTYADLKKDDITALSTTLPLAPSFKETYQVNA